MSSEVTTALVAELSDRELAAWRGMLRAHAALSKALDCELEAAHDIPLSSYEVLVTLRNAPDKRMRMAELADRVTLSRSGVTRLVDRLEADGHLRRKDCESDLRGCFASLTPAGEEFLARARATYLAIVRERFLGHFSERELEQLVEFWERLRPNCCTP